MRIKDALRQVAAYTVFMALSPVLLLIAIFCEESPEDSYKMQDW